MENVDAPATKRARLSVEQQNFDDQQPKPSSLLQARTAKKHRLCNELVCEVCKNIVVMNNMSGNHLLTAYNVYSYLAPRFSKTRAIYRDAFALINARLSRKKGFTIWLDRNWAYKGDETEESEHFVIRQKQSNRVFELETNYVKIRICNQSQKMVRFFPPRGGFHCVHLLNAVRLIGSLIQPNKLALKRSFLPSNENSVRLLNAMHNCIDWVELSANLFLESIGDQMVKYNKLHVDCNHWILNNGANAQRFRHELIQWLGTSNNRQPRQCHLLATNFKSEQLTQLLDDIKTDFCRATSQSSFAVRVCVLHPAEEPAFIVCNSVGEQLEMRHKITEGLIHAYTLIRRPIGEPDLDLGKGTEEEMAKIVFF